MINTSNQLYKVPLGSNDSAGGERQRALAGKYLPTNPTLDVITRPDGAHELTVQSISVITKRHAWCFRLNASSSSFSGNLKVPRVVRDQGFRMGDYNPFPRDVDVWRADVKKMLWSKNDKS